MLTLSKEVLRKTMYKKGGRREEIRQRRQKGLPSQERMQRKS